MLGGNFFHAIAMMVVSSLHIYVHQGTAFYGRVYPSDHMLLRNPTKFPHIL